MLGSATFRYLNIKRERERERDKGKNRRREALACPTDIASRA